MFQLLNTCCSFQWEMPIPIPVTQRQFTHVLASRRNWRDIFQAWTCGYFPSPPEVPVCLSVTIKLRAAVTVHTEPGSDPLKFTGLSYNTKRSEPREWMQEAPVLCFHSSNQLPHSHTTENSFCLLAEFSSHCFSVCIHDWLKGFASTI